MNEHKDNPLGFDADPASPDFARLAKVAAEIMALGYDAKTAAQYAALIGDQPIRDQDDNIIVQRGKEVLARLKLKSFGK